ncbi:hypothetical protein D3C87_1139420 [compost metagenome]
MPVGAQIKKEWLSNEQLRRPVGFCFPVVVLPFISFERLLQFLPLLLVHHIADKEQRHIFHFPNSACHHFTQVMMSVKRLNNTVHNYDVKVSLIQLINLVGGQAVDGNLRQLLVLCPLAYFVNNRLRHICTKIAPDIGGCFKHRKSRAAADFKNLCVWCEVRL